ncbi:MAG: DinB family protein [Candidatus Hydrogenedentota bacterium]
MLKKCCATLVVLTFPILAAFADDKPSPSLTKEEFGDLNKFMDESMDTLMGRITGLSDAQWNFKQNEDRWSVAECTEHIVRSERALLEYAQKALSGDADPEWFERTKGKLELLMRAMPNRNPGGAGGAQAPMEIRPTEHWDRAKAIQEYYSIHGEVRAYIETLDKPIKEYTFEHPFPVFGWLNAHDWLIYVPLHTIRHSRQIIEVQEDPNYPKE